MEEARGRGEGGGERRRREGLSRGGLEHAAPRRRRRPAKTAYLGIALQRCCVSDWHLGTFAHFCDRHLSGPRRYLVPVTG